MTRIVADLGNTRLKWGRIDPGGTLGATLALPTDDPTAWASAWASWGLSAEATRWSVATVNPPLADRFASFLASREVESVAWHRSAAEVSVRHDLESPESTGSDRALAVAGALARNGGRGPGLVVSCGTATTVERVSPDGVWQGGAIAPGLGPMARALHLLTAQLPEVMPREAPGAFGRSTVPALEAGVFWGMVGAIRELLHRQAEGLSPAPWVVWTGGDAARFAPWVEGPGAVILPHLVLEGLAREVPGSEGAGGSSPRKRLCPTCGRTILSRRSPLCSFCRQPLPDDLRFSPVEIARIEGEEAERDRLREIRRREKAEAARRDSPSSGDGPGDVGVGMGGF